jgi:uncharacterized membrane protein (DUF2068 family)
MRLWPKHWHPETWICSMQGHAAPAASAAFVGVDDAPLGAELADGRRLARCLRCDSWIEHLAPAGNEIKYETIPPLDQLKKPRRGKPLHEAIGMRLIAINKGTHAFGFTLVAIGLTLTRTNLFQLKNWAQRLLDFVQAPLNDAGQQHGQTWLGRQLEHILDLKTGTITVLLSLAVLYAAVEWVEAVGLWKEKRWAEYLTVIATAGFIPLEVKELLHKVTFFRVFALITNLALLTWLIYNKRLFGARGGHAALLAHDDVDWDKVLHTPTPAQGKLIRDEIEEVVVTATTSRA